MKEVRKTSQFKKDFKRIKNNDSLVKKLFDIVGYLQNEEPIPEEFCPHSLKGNWNDYMECHIESDTLLIWYDKESDVVKLVRLGSHSELFGNGRKR